MPEQDNGDRLRQFEVNLRLKTAKWDVEEIIRRRIGDSNFFTSDPDSGVGKFRGKPLIMRDTGINGGVCLGTDPREAIVVDDTADPKIAEIYDRLMATLKSGKPTEVQTVTYEQLFVTIGSLVRETIPHIISQKNGKETLDLLLRSIGKDREVKLSDFFGNGSCRHQALLAGYLLEKCIHTALISGTISLDRNFIPNVGGHAWIRFTDPEGQIYILDATQHYSGKIEDVQSGGKAWTPLAWKYQRPEEKKPLANRAVISEPPATEASVIKKTLQRLRSIFSK